jgi:predicted ATPase/class 3 adenylate cyclase
VTFLFTDIENSTQWWEEQPGWMAGAFARQEALIRAAVAAHGGYVYKMIGDAFQAAFATAPAALAAALAAQRALAAEPWGGGGPLRVRMALHTGITDERGDDYVGPVLNRVARLLAVAGGGQVLLSQAAFELARDHLPPDARLLDRGEHRLRDLIRPEHLYQLAAPGLPPGDAPLRTLDAFPHNLPLQVTSFVGRERELAEVKRTLLAERLVTLTGPGGTGKTRLALQAGAELLELFPDGVWLVELATLADPALVVGAVAQTLGVRESSGRPLLSLLGHYLRGKDLLLLLDNCEHLVDACAALVAALLAASPTVCVLASSREALGIGGEVAYRVPSLSVPDPRHPPAPEQLSAYDAVRLFIERAEAVQPGFAVTRDNAPALAAICQRLEGIPLAIELAAVRVRLLRPEQIAARLDDRFRLLTGGSRTALPRHQTLRALIDWSYDLLGAAERALLGRLAVFAGGWTLDAAEAVCADDGRQTTDDGRQTTSSGDGPPTADGPLPTADILDVLTALVNKSLVQAEAESGPEARYRLLETIRQYARDKLHERGGGAAVRGRHLAYYAARVAAAAPHLRAADQVAWLDRLDRDVDNLRAALEWSLQADRPAGLALAAQLLWFWHIRSHRSEGVEWLERLLAADGPAERAAARSPEHQLAHGAALNAAAALMVMHGNPERGMALAEESLALHRALGAPGKPGMAMALWDLAQGNSQHERLDLARSQSEQSLALYREVGDRFGVAQCLDNLGSYALMSGQYEEAERIWTEDLGIRRAIADRDGEAWVLTCLANLEFWRGNFERAMELFRDSHAAFLEVNNQWAVSMALSGMGAVMLSEGRFDEASEIYEAALAYSREMGDQNVVAGRRYDLARVAWSRGDYDRAAQLYEETLAYVREIENESAIAGTLYDLAGVAWAQGQYDLADKRYAEARGVADRIGARQTAAATLLGLARVALTRGDLRGARAGYNEALGLARSSPNPWGLGFALAIGAALAAAEHDLERAAILLGASQTAYEHLGYLLAPIERDEHQRTQFAVRSGLGEAAYTARVDEGRSMTLDQAVTHALAQDAKTLS